MSDKPTGVFVGGFARAEDAEREKKAQTAEALIAGGKVKVNPKNHVVRKGRGLDAEDAEVAGALDELDAVDDMFAAVLK